MDRADRGAGICQERPTPAQPFPLAYLLGPDEFNNDSTDYWIFSETGLRRLIERTGWNMMDYLFTGEVENADPLTAANDARSFCLLQSSRCAGAEVR